MISKGSLGVAGFLVCSLFFPLTAKASGNLLINGSFEGDFGWERTHHGSINSSGRVSGMGVEMTAPDGGWLLRIYDRMNPGSEGWASLPISVTPGTEYTARADVFVSQGSAPPYIYIKYYDGNGVQVEPGGSSASAVYGSGWRNGSHTASAPLGAESARVLLFSGNVATGSYYFDSVEFGRSNAQSLVDNSTFDLDLLGQGYPSGWSPWNNSSEPVSVGTDPTNPENQVLRLGDDDPVHAASATAYFEVSPGLDYRASARVYLHNSPFPSDEVRLYLKFLREGCQVWDQLSSDSRGFSTLGAWGDVSFVGHAPPEARCGAVVAACGGSHRCTASFDDIEVREEWGDNVRYVSPGGTCEMTAPSCGSAANPAKYTNTEFWSSVNAELATNPVKVVFETGNYEMQTLDDRVPLEGLGDSTNRLVVTGEETYGTVFMAVAHWPGGQMVRAHNSGNLSIRNFRLAGASGLARICDGEKDDCLLAWGISLCAHDGDPVDPCTRDPNPETAASYESVYLENIAVTDMPFKAGAVQVRGRGGSSLNDVRVSHGEFVRTGYHNGTHPIYASDALRGLQVEDSYFEDAAGTYVRLRSYVENTVVRDSFFHSTGTYANHEGTTNFNFVSIAVFPGKYPDHEWFGDEWFGNGYRIEGNVFEYSDPLCNTEEHVCKPLLIAHNGFDPDETPGDNIPTRFHLRFLESPYKEQMKCVESSCIARRQYLLADFMKLYANDCEEGICLAGNTFTNCDENRFGLYVVAPDKDNWTFDISNLFSYD